MAASLLIRDGVPEWYLSPDIWTVPGSDPNAAPGTPIIGQPAFVWGQVTNDGDRLLENIRVNFYWSNPATAVLRSTSPRIGFGFASIPPGESRTVLCLTPWVPVGVNNGHECLVAEAIHPSVPLPRPLPDAFSPSAFNQVAQRNFTLLRTTAGMMMVVAIQVAAPLRQSRKSIVRLIRGEDPVGDELHKVSGLGERRFLRKLPVRLSLGRTPEAHCETFEEVEKLEMAVPGGTVQAVYLKIHAGELDPGTYGLVSVVETDAVTKDLVGGITFAITARER